MGKVWCKSTTNRRLSLLARNQSGKTESRKGNFVGEKKGYLILDEKKEKVV
jgi:hypothetical protein